METERKGPVVVTGASGYVGSWLVMKLLQKGYEVRAAVRDSTNFEKVKPLLDLPGSNELLSIWKADLNDIDETFDEVTRGSVGLFHVATPMNFQSEDPENEVIKPTISGLLGILRSCKRVGTVKRVIFTSSAGTVNVEEHQATVYDESSWSDLDFVTRVKMTGWMYFVSKTLAEKAAWEFVSDNDIHFITIIPTLVVGSFLISRMPPSLITALSLITGNEAHYSILRQAQFVHLDDLCDAHIFLFEHHKANGRYICSSHDSTIYSLAKMLKNRYATYDIPLKFKEIDPNIESVSFSSKKLLDLGFKYKYKYTMEEMFDDAIKTCRDKNLIPLHTEEMVSANEKFDEVKEQIAVK
uniref:Flavanone 4-reductase n=1 Tax=Cymbidium hybrid cultivar TaxID=28471 RepID=O64902_9ASPA|nr:dihydroflavonol-4-reductase [Cymbidium hybrid cultivar]AIM58715.1 dihydroflavonol 4 reductase [Cymbidium hybrid cultivar]